MAAKIKECTRCKIKLEVGSGQKFLGLGDGRIIHEKCFVCYADGCKESLVDEYYESDDGQSLFCKFHYLNMISAPCYICGEPLVEGAITASGKQMHKTCLKCEVCATPLFGGKFLHKDGNFLCPLHLLTALPARAAAAPSSPRGSPGTGARGTTVSATSRPIANTAPTISQHPLLPKQVGSGAGAAKTTTATTAAAPAASSSTSSSSSSSSSAAKPNQFLAAAINSNMEEELRAAKAKILELENNLASTTSKCERLEASKKAAEAELATSHKNEKESKRALADVEAKYAELEKRSKAPAPASGGSVAGSAAEVKALNDKLKLAEEDKSKQVGMVKRLETQLDETKKAQIASDAKVDEMKKKVTALEQQNSSLTIDVKTFKDQAAAAQASLQSAKTENQATVSKLEQQVRQLNDKVSASSSTTKSSTDMEGNLKKETDRASAAVGKVKELEKAVDDLNQQLTKLRNENGDLQKRTSNFAIDEKTLNDRIKTLEDKLKTADAAAAKSSAAAPAAAGAAQDDATKKLLEASEARSAGLAKTVKEMESKHDEQVKKITALEHEKSALAIDLKTAKDQAAATQTQLQALQATKQENAAAMDKLEAQVKDLSSQLQAEKARNQGGSNASSEAAESLKKETERANAATARTKELEKSLEDVKAENVALQKKLASTDIAEKALKESVQGLETQVAHLQKENKNCKAGMEQLEASLAAAKAAAAAAAPAAAPAGSLPQDQAKIVKLEEDLKKLKADYEEEEERCMGLQRTVASMMDEQEAAQKEDKDQIKSLTARLAESQAKLVSMRDLEREVGILRQQVAAGGGGGGGGGGGDSGHDAKLLERAQNAETLVAQLQQELAKQNKLMTAMRSKARKASLIELE